MFSISYIVCMCGLGMASHSYRLGMLETRFQVTRHQQGPTLQEDLPQKRGLGPAVSSPTCSFSMGTHVLQPPAPMTLCRHLHILSHVQREEMT